MGCTLRLTVLYLDHNQLTRVPPEWGALSNLTNSASHYNQLTRVPPEWGALSNLTYLWLSHNKLHGFHAAWETLNTLKTLKTHHNPRLCYPPAGLKDPLEYLRNHKDTVSPWGRLKHAWGGIRLMWIASNDSGCSTTFGRLPVEVIWIIRRFILADPYLETPE